MSAAVPMTLPSSRTLLGWWRDLSPLSPVRFSFAHLVLHRIEALVEFGPPPVLYLLAPALLRLLALRAPVPMADLGAELALDAGLAGMLVGVLADEGLVEVVEGRSVRLTGAGRECAANSSTIAFPRARERRGFYFVDDRPPWYLPLPAGMTTPLSPPAGWRFELTRLDACLAEPAEWKRQHGFPEDVARLVPAAEVGGEEGWRGVPVDQPEQALLVLVQTRKGQMIVLGARVDGWTLSPEPALQLPAGGPVWAALWQEPAPEAWKQAWQAWCQQRSLPAGEVEACKLEPTDHRLVVRAPGRLVDRLRQARSDALRGEAWILAGSGRVRAAAQIELAG